MANSTLDSLTQTSDGQYADFWNPQNDDPASLAGVITDVRMLPPFDEGGDKKPVWTVRTLGGDDYRHEAGEEYSTPTHANVLRLLDDKTVGDVVHLKFMGEGERGYTYEIGFVPQSEWTENDDADWIQEIIDMGAMGTDDRPPEEQPQRSGFSEGAADSVADADPSVPPTTEAEEFLVGMMEMHDGEMSLAELQETANDVRNFGINVETVVSDLGYQVEDGTVYV